MWKWKWLRRLLDIGASTSQAGSAQLPEIPLIPAESSGWGVPVLDVRPVTQGLLSASRDPHAATNLCSFDKDDGLGFSKRVPPSPTTIPCALTYRRDRLLADGPLFIPREMEDKWAIFHHGGRILCVRSWTRKLQVAAQVEQHGDAIIVRAINGSFSAEGEAPEYTVRALDFLLRSHALEAAFPTPLPTGFDEMPQAAAIWCMSVFGRRAALATTHPVTAPPPERPLRADSLLHLAVGRGKAKAVRAELAKGVPPDLAARDGSTPLHWAVNWPDAAMIDLLLAAGATVDDRSDEGATALMGAIQWSGHHHQVEPLLRRGADPAARDHRGFTALHRAAEMGHTDLVRLLLAHGAPKDAVALGHTPLSLARQRGHAGIVQLLT